MGGNSLKLVLLAAAMLLAQAAGLAQDLHLKSRTIYTGARPAEAPNREIRIPRRAVPRHQIIQFDHLPGVEDLEALLSAGYKVVAAVPDNGVMVMSPARSTVTAQTDGVRWIGELEALDKLSPELDKT